MIIPYFCAFGKSTFEAAFLRFGAGRLQCTGSVAQDLTTGGYEISGMAYSGNSCTSSKCGDTSGEYNCDLRAGIGGTPGVICQETQVAVTFRSLANHTQADCVRLEQT